MKVLILLILLILFTLIISDNEKCCETCIEEGNKKYYSIDNEHDRCGECCMTPDNYNIFLKFEPGLKEATVDHPCSEEGYTEYEETETHGGGGYSMTLDKYKKPITPKCCESCTVEGHSKYYSIDTEHDRCGECCMAPNLFETFKQFEPGLTEATVDHPCKEKGYTEYELTESHGTDPYSMTLDKYKKPNEIKEEKCCETCTEEGNKKYYSIDTEHDRCGECCMTPDNYNIFLKFEPGLKEATVDHPCSEEGYTEYEETEIHGGGGYSMTLDKYKKKEISNRAEVNPKCLKSLLLLINLLLI